MAHYLRIIETTAECEGCSEEITPGIVGLTDEIHPDQLDPLCKRCLISQDRRLAMIMIATFAGMPLEQMDEVIRRSLRLPEFAEWVDRLS